MKKLILTILLTRAIVLIHAQSIEQIKTDRQTYIWGEGTGTTVKSADQNALAEIIGQISTQVENTSIGTTTETNNEFKRTWNDVVKTYSSATLSNTERIIIQSEPDAKVFRYVKRNEIAKIFESRKNKIIELAKNGDIALKNLQITDALRYFYWSQTLLRSHPDASNIKMTNDVGKDILLITWIPTQINQIFVNLSVTINKVESKESYTNYILGINYKNLPVRNLDYTYWGGQDWSNIVSAKDGIGVLELPKTQTNGEIRIKCEYVFEGESAIDLELRDVMQKLPEIPYKNCYLKVNESVTNTNINPINAITTALAITKNSNETIKPILETKNQDMIMKKLIGAISNKNYAAAQPLFTSEGFVIFQSLLQYGNAKILKELELKYFQFGEMIICRSIPMSFNFKTNNRTFVEDVVFYFDKHNKIDNITFGLSKKAVEDIAGNTNWSEEVRMQLINFMENYKTAYALKRLDYIEKIFSDDALIITGRVTKTATSPEFKYMNNSIVKFNQQSKSQYLKNLKYSFGSNEYINLRFTDNTVKQSGKSKSVYGIQIKQDYFSSNYGDSGYLFLLIDFTDSIAPQIHVRTWQPNKNADGSIYGLSDF